MRHDFAEEPIDSLYRFVFMLEMFIMSVSCVLQGSALSPASFNRSTPVTRLSSLLMTLM